MVIDYQLNVIDISQLTEIIFNIQTFTVLNVIRIPAPIDRAQP